VRVADFSRVLAGPYATMILGDLGADVIKVEGPLGDETRHWRPPVDASGRSSYYTGVNRNKRAITLDLARDGDRSRALALASSADIVIENFRPGVMERFGLGYEALCSINPRIIYCSITGFGAGKGRELPGFDLLVQAQSGLMSVTGWPDGPPTKVGVAIVDVLTGQNAVIGILAALREREHSGLGQRVEATLLMSALSGLANLASGALATGEPPTRMGNSHPSIAPYDVFPTADGDLVIAVGNDRQFSALAQLLGAPQMATDPRFADNPARVSNRSELHNVLCQLLGAESAEHWCAVLSSAGVPAGKVNNLTQALAFAGSLGLDPVVHAHGDPGTSVANPIRLSRTPAEYRFPAPDPLPHQDWLER